MRKNLSKLQASLVSSLKDQNLFKDIPDNILLSSLLKVEELYVLKDELIFKKGESYHKGIYIVLSGKVLMETPKETASISEGAILGASAFLTKTVYSITALAGSDSSLLFIDEYSIYTLVEKAEGFKERFYNLITERLDLLELMSSKIVVLSPSQSVGSCMSAPLVTLHNSKTVAEAAKLMSEHKIGSIVIMNRKHVLKGLLTLGDLASKYLSGDYKDPNSALAEDYADPDPLVLPQDYPLAEALSEMRNRGVEYALVTRKGKLAGIVSKYDVMALSYQGSDIFGASVARAANMSELREVTTRLPKILSNIINNTSMYRDILPTLSSCHLVIQKRAFELTAEAYKVNHGRKILSNNFSLMSLGSLARREMTLEMSQDHAVVLDDSISDESVSDYRQFFKDFSENLAYIGYQYHPLGMSLDNPLMVRRASEWDTYISESIHSSVPDNIPEMRILFDCERLEGDDSLLWRLKDKVRTTLKEKSLYFGKLIDCQSLYKIPISQFGSFITDRDGDDAGIIDLKEAALGFMVYTAQALSLSEDLYDMGTLRRVEHLGRIGKLSDDMVKEIVSAYESVIGLVLHEQLDSVSIGEPVSFKIRPAGLSMYNQERLKRALHVIARFFGEGLSSFKRSASL